MLYGQIVTGTVVAYNDKYKFFYFYVLAPMNTIKLSYFF